MGNRPLVLWVRAFDIVDLVCVPSCNWRFMQFWVAAFDLSNMHNMPSALRLHCVHWVQGVCDSVRVELDVVRLVDVLTVEFVVRDVRPPILFQLVRSRVSDVFVVHVIPSFEPLILPIGVRIRPANVLDVQLIVVVSHLYCLLVCDFRLENLGESILNETIPCLRDLLRRLVFENVEPVLEWIVLDILVLMKPMLMKITRL